LLFFDNLELKDRGTDQSSTFIGSHRISKM